MVLLRHGQSLWNKERRFTGWSDVELTDQGRAEARAAGQLLRSNGVTFDLAFTSLLGRAEETLRIVLGELDIQSLPIFRAWQLNERHYGTLEGLTVNQAVAMYGWDAVQLWRNSYQGRPPPLAKDDPRHPSLNPRYVRCSCHPGSESLKDTRERLLPFWKETIAPHLQSGHKVLVVSHGNSLRVLVQHLGQMSLEHLGEVRIPTGSPIVYDRVSDMEPLLRRSLDLPL